MAAAAAELALPIMVLVPVGAVMGAQLLGQDRMPQPIQVAEAVVGRRTLQVETAVLE